MLQSLYVALSAANLIRRARIIKMADYKPKYPISSAIPSSFYYNGVGSGSSYLSNAYTLPKHESSPTTITTIRPSPLSTLVPESITIEGTSFLLALFCPPSFLISFLLAILFSIVSFLIGSVSQVIALSSAVISDAWRTTQSEGISIPSKIYTISPTMTSL